MIKLAIPHINQQGTIVMQPIDYHISLFPDGTKKYHLTPTQILMSENITISYYYSSPEDFMDLFTVIETVRSIHPKAEISLFIMYMPYARLDRIEQDGETFTLQTFIRILKTLPYNNLYIFDPHSNITDILLDNKRSFIDKEVMEKVLGWIISTHLERIFPKQESFYIAFPDNGSQKRYTDFLKRMGYDQRIKGVFVGNKYRDWKSGEIKELSIKMIAGEWITDKSGEQNVVIFDDILTTGKTIECFIEKFNQKEETEKYGKPKFYLYSSHMEPSVYKSKLLDPENKLIEKILTTTSLDFHKGIETLTEEDKKKGENTILKLDVLDIFMAIQSDIMKRAQMQQEQQMKAMAQQRQNKILTPKDL